MRLAPAIAAAALLASCAHTAELKNACPGEADAVCANGEPNCALDEARGCFVCHCRTWYQTGDPAANDRPAVPERDPGGRR